MTNYEQTLKALETQFNTTTDALVKQYEAATRAVLLAQEAVLRVEIVKFEEKKVEEPVVARKYSISPTSPPPFVVTPEMEAKMSEPRARVPLSAVPSSEPPPAKAPWVYEPTPLTKSGKVTGPPVFVAPPAETDKHIVSATIGEDGRVNLTMADGPGPEVTVEPFLPFVPLATPPPARPTLWVYRASTRVEPTTSAPLAEVERAGSVKAEPPPFIAPLPPVEATVAPWGPPPTSNGWEPVLDLGPEGRPAPVFVPGEPAMTLEAQADGVDDVGEGEHVLLPGDINDAWCPGPDQTWKDEPEPVDPWADEGGEAAPVQSAKMVVQTPPAVSQDLGGPSCAPGGKSAMFVPRTKTRSSVPVTPLRDGGEPKLASVRFSELREGRRSDLKTILSGIYVGPDGRYLMSYWDVMGMDTDKMVCAMLDHEAAEGWVTRDFAWRAA